MVISNLKIGTSYFFYPLRGICERKYTLPEYRNLPKLSACKNDLLLMRGVVEKSRKYDDMLILDDSVGRAYDANEKIIQFVEKYKGDNEIDEVLLYFSGHGNFENNEFYYGWGDYEKTRKRQTCLGNTEIDGFLRSLNAKLTVKIIDACNSGVPYLKGNSGFDKFLSNSKDAFQKCYFLFSSQNDEPSGADSQISLFTKSILNSLKSFDEGKGARYRDIINYVSDEFDKNGGQTPFFVTQCDYTDVFLEVNSEIKSVLGSELLRDSSDAVADLGSSDVPVTLLDLVRKDAGKYVPFEDVNKYLEYFKKKLSAEKLNPVLKDLYAIEVDEITNLKDVPQIKDIASWIQTKNKETYTQLHFVSVPYEEKVLKNPFALRIHASLFASEEDYKTVTKYREEVDSFSNTLEMPYTSLNVVFKGLLPNLMNVSLCVVPVLSRTSVCFFISKIDYKRSGWDDQVMDSFSAKWEFKEVLYEQTAIDEVESKAFHKVEQYVIDLLKSKFPVKGNEN